MAKTSFGFYWIPCRHLLGTVVQCQIKGASTGQAKNVFASLLHERVLRQKLERGERLMGFGHAVYKVRDPRAGVLAAEAERFYENKGDRELYELAKEVERVAVKLLEEYKPGRNLQTNVEFYTALLLHGLGLPTELFTPTFALGRAAGWIAHCFDQKQLDQIIRPKLVYTGRKDRTWVPLDERVPKL
jgi:citrate synthase